MFTKENNHIRFDDFRNLSGCSDYILYNSLTSSDDTDLQENYSLSILLLTQSLTKFLFPFSVTKQYLNDPPDFIIAYDESACIVGLEHVIATEENFQMASKEIIINPNIKWLESSYYTYEKKIPKNRAFIGLKRKDEGLSGSPLFGDFHINNWVKIVLNAIMKKSQDIPKWNKTSPNSKELLVQAKITPMIGEEHLDAIFCLKKRYSELYHQSEYHFDKVHIFSQSRVILDVFGNVNILFLGKDQILKLSELFKTPNHASTRRLKLRFFEDYGV